MLMKQDGEFKINVIGYGLHPMQHFLKLIQDAVRKHFNEFLDNSKEHLPRIAMVVIMNMRERSSAVCPILIAIVKKSLSDQA